MADLKPWERYSAAPAAAGPQVIVPVAPTVVAKDETDLANARLSGQRTQQQIAQDAASAPFQARQAAATATKAELDAEKARRDLAAQQSTANPQQQKAMASLANDEILAAIVKARQDLTRTGAAGFAARLPEMVQPQSAIDLSGSLNTIASRLTLDKLAQMKTASPTGASGLGSLTEKEGGLLRDSVAGLGQTQSPERLLENLAAVEKHYRNYTALTAGEDYNDPKVAAKYGIATIPEPGQAQTFATGANRDEADPALQGVNSRIRSMLGAGRNAGEIVAYMNSIRPGLGDASAPNVAKAVTFRGQNPTVPLDRYAISVESRAVPMSGFRQGLNAAAQTAPGAYLMRAGDALTAGTMDNMAPNPALARAGMDAASKANPIASILGSLSGGAIAGGLAEGAFGGLAAGRAAPILADMAYGGAYGAGSADEGSRLNGATSGALTGVVGGMLGRRAAGMFGSAFRGVRDKSAQALRDAGIPLTIGQAVGGKFKAREDRLAGFGGVGDAINARRLEGVQAFNRAAYNEALAPIGQQATNQVGEAAVEQADDAVGAAYRRALDSVRLQRDRSFGVDMQGPTALANRLPGETGENARYTLSERVGKGFDPNGGMSGNDFQQSVRGLEMDARGVRNAPYGNDFGTVAKGARTALEDMLERQSPGSLDDYLSANAAYRNTSVLGEATAAAMNTGGVFTPAQLGNAARANARKFTGRLSAATTDRPFFDLQRAGQDVLPSKIPDSGTAGRIEEAGGLTAMARRTARNLTNAPLYAEATQPALNRLLLDRPDLAVRLGDELLKRKRVGGMFGRPLALQYSPLAVTEGY
jgi:hypothetical protein